MQFLLHSRKNFLPEQPYSQQQVFLFQMHFQHKVAEWNVPIEFDNLLEPDRFFYKLQGVVYNREAWRKQEISRC